MMLIVLLNSSLNWMTTGCGISQMVISNAPIVFATLKLVTQISTRQGVHMYKGKLFGPGWISGGFRLNELGHRQMLKHQWILHN